MRKTVQFASAQQHLIPIMQPDHLQSLTFLFIKDVPSYSRRVYGKSFSVVLQNAAERAHAEQLLRVFGQSTDYITHCKVRSYVRQAASSVLNEGFAERI
jgi:hypothetical protein